MSTSGIDEKYLEGLKSGELLLKLTWDEWLTVNAPFENVDFSVEDVTVRYHRNGDRLGHARFTLLPGAGSRPASRLRLFRTAEQAAKRSWTSRRTADPAWPGF